MSNLQILGLAMIAIPFLALFTVGLIRDWRTTLITTAVMVVICSWTGVASYLLAGGK